MALFSYKPASISIAPAPAPSTEELPELDFLKEQHEAAQEPAPAPILPDAPAFTPAINTSAMQTPEAVAPAPVEMPLTPAPVMQAIADPVPTASFAPDTQTLPSSVATGAAIEGFQLSTQYTPAILRSDTPARAATAAAYLPLAADTVTEKDPYEGLSPAVAVYQIDDHYIAKDYIRNRTTRGASAYEAMSALLAVT